MKLQVHWTVTIVTYGLFLFDYLLIGLSENIVQDALKDVMKGRAVFVIAHRLNVFQHASRIIVLDDGKIVEIGKQESIHIFTRTYLYTPR